MVNIASSPPNAAEQQFIDGLAELLAPWGMAPSHARVYGYVLLHEQPVSLDAMASELQLSKVGVWKAARALEAFGHIRRYGEAGSKRALYGPSDEFEQALLKQSALLGALATLMRDGAGVAARDAGAGTRLRRMGRLYAATRKAIEQTVAAQRTTAARGAPR